MATLDEIAPANALIVGGSRGIGLGFVNQLIEDDRIAHLYVTCRHPNVASELLELQQQHPQRLTRLELDITQESQIVAAVQAIQSSTTHLHLVINSVGILHENDLQPEKSLSQINPDHLMRYFQVNSIGAVLLAKHLLPLFRHGDRSIFATISAKIGSIEDNYLGGWYGYRASKAALNMLLRTVAIEYNRKSPKTIVAMLHPGTTDTQLSQPFQRNVPAERLFPIERTVTQLLAIIDQLGGSDSGYFFSWDGSRLPW